MMRIPPDAPILTAQAMRAAEQAVFDTGIAQAELMTRAGEAVALQVRRFAGKRPVLVLAGPGNNGGDAYVVARKLLETGVDVAVAALGHAPTGAAAAMRDAWTGAMVSLDAACPRPVLVDGLFGTGLTRPLETSVAKRLQALVDAAEMTIAIDLPSGLATDSGAALGAPDGVDVTVALGALKPAHLLADGLSRCGHVVLAEIGIPAGTAWRTIARPRLSAPAADAHKYSRGLVVVVEGVMPGAARLAAGAALSAGAGYVMLAGSEGAGGPDALVRKTVGNAQDLAGLLDDQRIGSVVIGPGLGRDAAARALLDVALRSALPLVIDGDALTLLGEDAARRLAGRAAPAILTPHAGEFERMFGAGGDSKIERALAAAAATGCTLIFKGGDTVIAAPDGRVRVLADGSSWLSTAGTGDVLAGTLAARMAAGGDAAVEAAWLHARAASMAGPAFHADDLIAMLPGAIACCL